MTPFELFKSPLERIYDNLWIQLIFSVMTLCRLISDVLLLFPNNPDVDDLLSVHFHPDVRES